MTLHDDAVSLRQMLEHGREAVELVQGHKREHLDSDRVLSLAVTRLVEIVGEAAHLAPTEAARCDALVTHDDRFEEQAGRVAVVSLPGDISGSVLGCLVIGA